MFTEEKVGSELEGLEKIVIGVDLASFSGFDETADDGAGLGASGRIGKKEILTTNDKRTGGGGSKASSFNSLAGRPLSTGSQKIKELGGAEMEALRVLYTESSA